MATWEMILVGVVLVLVLLWIRPGVKATIQQSRNAERDWPGLLLPLGAVILFVLLLLAMV